LGAYRSAAVGVPDEAGQCPRTGVIANIVFLRLAVAGFVARLLFVAVEVALV